MAGVGLSPGIIGNRISVAIIVMALATLILAAPAMNRLQAHISANCTIWGPRPRRRLTEPRR